MALIMLCWAGAGDAAPAGRVAASNLHLSAEAPPALLSATGLFTDIETLTPTAGLRSYEVNASAWNDGATERHWFGQMALTQTFALPQAAPDPYSYQSIPGENWFVPAGTVFVQHLEVQMQLADPTSARRIETRVLVKTGEGCYGLSYRWNDAQTDATLVAPNGESQTLTVSLGGLNVRRQTWEFPSRNSCTQCHNAVAGRVLSFKTAQLNRFVNGVNQIEQLGAVGYLDRAPAFAGTLPAMAGLRDENATASQQARSYLAVNCSPCHQANGGRSSWDVRFGLTDAQTRLFQFNGPAIAGNSAGSSLVQRMTAISKSLVTHTLGSHLVDQVGANEVSIWINALNQPPKVTLTEQPGDRVAIEGDWVSFTVNVEKTGPRMLTDLALYKNGSVVDGKRFHDMMIPDVTIADEGVYQFVARTRLGLASGKPFRLIVLKKGEAPRITNVTGPTASTGFSNGAFTVDAVGSGPLTYQWRHNGKPIKGATDKSVRLWYSSPGVGNAGEYTVAVTCNGKTTVSAPWPVTIAYDPVDISPVAQNGSVTLQVITAGPVAGLQWLKDGIPVPGATGATFTLSHITQPDKSSYTCRVSSPNGDQTTRSHTIVIVTDRPHLSPFALPAAQTGNGYVFDFPLDPAPEHTPSKVTVTGLPKGIYFYYSSSGGQLNGIVDTSVKAPSSYPLIITATNPLGSTTVRVILTLIPPDPIFAGVYTAIIKPSPEVAPQGGRLDVMVSVSGMATGRLWLGQRAYPLVMSGYYIDSSYIPGAEYVITPTPHYGLSFETNLEGENGAYRRLFFAVDGTFLEDNSFTTSSGLELWRPSGATWQMVGTTLQGWAKTRSVLPFSGRHHFAMHGSVSSPGLGTLSFGANGYSTVAGRLPDGTAFATSAWMSDALQWMIYAPLYRGQGYVSGSGKAFGAINGEATWNHPAPAKPTAGDFGLFTLSLSDH